MRDEMKITVILMCTAAMLLCSESCSKSNNFQDGKYEQSELVDAFTLAPEDIATYDREDFVLFINVVNKY